MLVYHIRTLLLLAALILAITAWWRIPPPRGRSFNCAAAVTFLALPLEAFGYISTLFQYNNSSYYNAFVLVEFILVVSMVYSDRLRTPGFGFTVAGGVTCFLLNLSFVDPRAEMLIEAIVATSLLLAVTIFHHLWRLANTSQLPVHRSPTFWLLTGTLLYFAGLPPVVTIARFVYAQDTSLAAKLWTVVPLLCALRYIMIAYAFHLARQERRPSSA